MQNLKCKYKYKWIILDMNSSWVWTLEAVRSNGCSINGKIL